MIGISLFTSIDVSPPVFVYQRNLNTVNEEAFDGIFNCSLPWEILTEADINLSLDLLIEKITWTLDHLCPMRKVRQKVEYQPWMNKNLKSMCKYKRYLFNQAKNSHSAVVWNIYKQYRNRVKRSAV